MSRTNGYASRYPGGSADCAAVAGVTGSAGTILMWAKVSDDDGNVTQCELVVELADYLAKRVEQRRSDEATAVRGLHDLVRNQRLG